jgi:predicted DNA-binding protein
MHVLEQTLDNVTLTLSKTEAETLCNALNESLENLDDWEFETRMGVPKDAVERLLGAFSRLA